MIRTAILKNNIYIQKLDIFDKNINNIKNVAGFLNSKDNNEKITEYIDQSEFNIKYNVMKNINIYSYEFEYQNKLFNIHNTYEIKPPILIYNYNQIYNKYHAYSLILNLHKFGVKEIKTSYIRDNIIKSINKINMKISDKDYYLKLNDFLNNNNQNYISNEDIYRFTIKTYLEIYNIKDCVFYSIFNHKIK